MNLSVAMNDFTDYPQDPRTKNYYPYAVSKNRQAFQIATIIEDSSPWKAYVDGDYKTVAKNVLPSLLLAVTKGENDVVEIAEGVVTEGSSGSENRKKFIVNQGTANLPYGEDGNVKANTDLSFAEILSQT